MFGILNVHKPAGMTSRDVVNHVQRRVRPHKVGHAGTLDPLATGVLVLCVGPATKLIEYVQRMPKQYVGAFRLGCRSETEDVEGDVVELADRSRPDRTSVEDALLQFIGKILQRPPAFSALKVDGERAYKLARAGKQVNVRPREIEIHDLRLIEYEFPRLVIDIRCGSGTYVRSLGRDIAETLGTAAVMENLQRTAVGEFRIDDAISLEDLPDRARVEEHLLPPQSAVAMLPKTTVDDDQIEHLVNGRFIEIDLALSLREVVALSLNGELVAVLARRIDGRWGSSKNFAHLVLEGSDR